MEEEKVANNLTSAAAFVEGGIQEACDDACSICLEAFCDSDPSMLTTCKHEFHLQCILEWCQRSSQCPMCWQSISLKDPSRSPAHTSPNSQDRAGPSDLQSFSDSLKSRLSTLSTRYKESITKSTRGWKERLFARNSSTPEPNSEARGEVDQRIANDPGMSVEMSSERVCYVPCNFCNIILAASVPSSCLLSIVTVRCGHCANLLSVNMGGLLQSAVYLQDFQKQQSITEAAMKESGSSSKCNIFHPQEQPKMPPMRPPDKRQRVPSAYKRFIKEEIQKIKASNPEITHFEAFSAAAKNWADLPRIHFGLGQPAKMSHADHAAA